MSAKLLSLRRSSWKVVAGKPSTFCQIGRSTLVATTSAVDVAPGVTFAGFAAAAAGASVGAVERMAVTDLPAAALVTLAAGGVAGKGVAMTVVGVGSGAKPNMPGADREDARRVPAGGESVLCQEGIPQPPIG